MSPRRPSAVFSSWTTQDRLHVPYVLVPEYNQYLYHRILHTFSTLAQASVFDLVFIFTFVVLGSSRSVTYISISLDIIEAWTTVLNKATFECP